MNSIQGEEQYFTKSLSSGSQQGNVHYTFFTQIDFCATPCFTEISGERRIHHVLIRSATGGWVGTGGEGRTNSRV